jgi:hypothetical protein
MIPDIVHATAAGGRNKALDNSSINQKKVIISWTFIFIDIL